MTIDLTVKASEHNEEIRKKETKIIENFFDISMRKSNESIYERSQRVLNYFDNLKESEKRVIESRFSLLLEYLKESRECFYEFK